MRSDHQDLDDEDRGNRLTGSLDAFADMMAGQTPGCLTASTGDLACLMRLLAAEAHALHDQKFGPRPPKASNNNLA